MTCGSKFLTSPNSTYLGFFSNFDLLLNTQKFHGRKYLYLGKQKDMLGCLNCDVYGYSLRLIL